MPLDSTSIDARPGEDDPFSRYNTPASPILFPVAERKLGWETRAGSYERIPTHKAIIRVSPNNDGVKVLGVVGANYKLVHNRDLFSHVEKTLCNKMQHHQLDDVQVKDRVSGWGRVCYREYIFPSIKCNIGGGARSDIAFRLIVQNGYGDSALRVHAGAIEFYCTNGMISGEYQSAYRRHTKLVEVSGFTNVVDKSLDQFAKNQDRWQAWASKPVRPLDAMELFRELANSDRLRENLGNQYMRERDVRGENLWAVYSALTYYASHADGDFTPRATEQDSLANTMLQRELNVAKWTNSDAWKKLEVV